tara:strand:+ start:317 stop:505 length:189 start_codon:yes stop_codon:yes gene_type:complete
MNSVIHVDQFFHLWSLVSGSGGEPLMEMGRERCKSFNVLKHSFVNAFEVAQNSLPGSITTLI